MSAPEPVHDPEAALRVVGGRAELAAHLLELFLRELASAGAELGRLHAANEVEALRARVHKLAGSALYCGAPRLRRACGDLERVIAEGSDAAAVAGAMAAVLDEIEGFRGAVGGARKP